MKNKRMFIILIIFVIVMALVGGTLAYFSWRSASNTAVTFTVEAGFSCAADGGGNITSSQVMLAPSSCTNSTYAIKRTVKVMPTVKNGKVYMDLWLNINKLDTGLKNSDNFNCVLSTSSTSCTTGVVASGNFKGKEVGNKILLLSDKKYLSTATETYYLYIWLDSVEESTETMNQTFDLSLGGECNNQGAPSPNAPEIYDGLVPVIISNDGTVTVASTDDDNWYDYSNKKWANAVLVDNTSEIQESFYKNKNIGINKINNDLRTIADNSKDYNYYKTHVGGVISEDDILAYFVWIPRYKYRIWTTEVSATGNEQEIDIKFEEVTSISTGNSVGEYLTHPAFTFGNKQLSGIWVGKFETTEKTSSGGAEPKSFDFSKEYFPSQLPLYGNKEKINKTRSAGGGSSGSVYDNPTIKPNTSSLRSQNVANQFQTALKFSGGTLSSGNVTFTGNSTYGLSSSTDSHMMKNSEWGAVAYLSHSKYGINSEIRINNYWNNGTLTGCGASSSVNRGSTSSCEIAYGGATTYPQSTTGNISGIFDMSGGAAEFVMGNFNQEVGRSGFTTLLPSKYYDLYSETQFTGDYESNMALCTIATCGGHALSETAGWYNGYAYFVGSSTPWFARSGSHSNEAGAGAFVSYNIDGIGGGSVGFRVVLSS